MNGNADAQKLAIIFARVPRLGAVKTRLAQYVGEVEALRVHRVLLCRTLRVATAIEGLRVELSIAGDDTEGECAALAARWGATLTRQRGRELGERMSNALVDALSADMLPVLVGSDCPVLAREDLTDAFAALEQVDAVFSPTEDGGYALVGVRRALPEIFDGIAWGGADVMACTRVRLEHARARCRELRTLWDLDEQAGYRRWSEGQHAN